MKNNKINNNNNNNIIIIIIIIINATSLLLLLIIIIIVEDTNYNCYSEPKIFISWTIPPILRIKDDFFQSWPFKFISVTNTFF